MKYQILVKILHFLVLAKRVVWWLSAKFYAVLAAPFKIIWRIFGFAKYRLSNLTKKINISLGKERLLKRGFLQLIILIIIFLAALPQTKLMAKEGLPLFGRKTIAYALLGGGEDYELQEVVAEPSVAKIAPAAWKAGALSGSSGATRNPQAASLELDYTSIVAGGSAIAKPILAPGFIIAGALRTQEVTYVVESGDSLGNIAERFNVSVATVLWENKLTARSIIRPGDILKIPPTTGLFHVIKKGDNLNKIAKLYNAKAEEIIKFNRLKIDGTDLVIGEKIMIPGGIKPASAVAAITRRSTTASTIGRVAVPPRSLSAPSASGFLWPTRARTITQYFGWRHRGLDVAGPWQTPNYAAKAGVVEKSQCGWNNGYGCMIIIDHGGGVKTLYGHNSVLLVSPGEQVEAGQTIALMGNTGKVRGVTGIHLHFEVRVNGAAQNPLRYVR